MRVALAIVLCASSAWADGRTGLYAGLLAGGGIVDAGAVEPGIVAGQVGRLSLTSVDGIVRLGQRSANGLSLIEELRGGILTGAVGGSGVRRTLGAGVGLQWNAQLESVSPYLNVRGDARQDDTQWRAVLALGLGFEVPIALGAFGFEVSVEPISPSAFSVRVGVLAF